jgi:hypothetical protein
MRDKVQIRLAVDGAGMKIAEVLRENGITFEADWSKVYPHWLIATVDEKVIGCCQVVPSLPVGYIEFLFVRPGAPFKLRAIAIKKLMGQAFTTLHLAGSQYAGATLDQRNVKFAGVVEKIHAVKTIAADVYIRRLQ